MELIKQEVSQERWIEIPNGARRLPALAADAALPRAPPREGARYAGAHLLQVRGRLAGRAPTSRTPRSPRPTTTRKRAVESLTTETGAGQWGSALAMACNFFGLECEVYMVRVSYDQKPYRPEPDAGVRRHGDAQPVRRDERGPRGARAGSRVAGLARDRDLGGGRGAATSGGGTKYCARLGAEPRPHAPDGHRARGARAARDGGRVPGRPRRLHRRRLELRRLRAALRPEQPHRPGKKTRVVAVEPAAAPSLTKGKYVYDFGDTADDARSSRCTRSATRSSRRRSTPAGCATTGWRRSSRALYDARADRGGGRPRRTPSSRRR